MFQRLVKCLRSCFPRPSRVHLGQEYLDAHNFKNSFRPRDETDYTWVAEYAQIVYTRLDQADQTLDSKADALIRVLGGGAGLLTLGMVANIAKLSGPVVFALGIALAFALASICFAALARLPRETFLPPSIAWALTYADAYGMKASAQFLAQWHLTCEGMRLLVRAKSLYVKYATWLAILCFGAVALSFLVAACTMDSSAS